jgi:hypothetical protein
LARVFGGTAAQGAQALRQWLQALGITPRELRHTEAGRTQLDQEMRSARGRNFIVNR